MPDPDPVLKLVKLAISGDESSLRQVVELITPSIQRSVVGTLRRRVRSKSQSRARHEVEDLTQEVLFALLDDDYRRLRTWDPERGLSLPRWAELVSRHMVETFLRKPERRVWENKPFDAEFERLPDTSRSPETLAEHRELLRAVLAAVELKLTSDAREVFRMLILEERSVEEVCAETGLSQNAVHVKRHRILACARDAARRITRGQLVDD